MKLYKLPSPISQDFKHKITNITKRNNMYINRLLKYSCDSILKCKILM